ncbi:L,D-transpeptidase family protein [Sphingomonadaceae bacterium LXI357]|uniref:L,D-transpeptidase family protein n=1 Tax=Stakelama marina TaxID=2826939 RepID=A0A8T4IG49_9SPHN|nr:L,D-transpeptidase family protein [Stakelama marina]
MLAPGSAAIAGQRTVELFDAARALDNGQSVWADDVGETGKIEIVVSLPMQTLFVYRAGRLIGATSVSTGKPGKSTPTGEFPILQKQVFHRSNLYSNAPMPFMQRLTWSGVAMHAGYLPGYPASHGCIRMPRAFAKRLYSLTSLDTPVLVTRQSAPDRAGPRTPPLLSAKPGDYTSERFNIVTDDEAVFAGPGQPVFAPAKAVIQPVPPGK